MNNLKVTRKLIFTLMLGMFLISMVSGYDPHKQSTDFDLVISSNNATACNLTYVQSPNNTKVIYNVALDKDGQTFAKNVTSNNFTDIGDTCMGITCYDGVGYEVGSVCASVSYFGQELSSAQSTLYVALLGILIFILFVNFWIMGHLPASNERDEEGRILSINYLKYFRLVLWIFAYFFFVAIIFLSSNIAFAFLGEQLFANLLLTLFRVLLGFSPLVIIVIFISFFVKFFHDKKIQELFKRGIAPGWEI